MIRTPRRNSENVGADGSNNKERYNHIAVWQGAKIEFPLDPYASRKQ